MARKLHDTTMQNLAAALLLIDRLASPGHPLGPATESPREEVRALINRSVEELRDFSNLLYPSLLDAFGMVPALKASIAEFERQSGIAVRFSAHQAERGARAPNIERALVRVVEEALANLYRHSNSRAAEVRLTQSADETVVEIVDRGRGGPDWVRSRGVREGMIRARLDQLHGKLRISPTDSGASVTVRIPHEGGLDDHSTGGRISRRSVAHLKTPQRIDAEPHRQSVTQAVPEKSRRIKRWRDRAEELRTTAQQFSHPSAQSSLRMAADNYDRLADRAEKQCAGTTTGAIPLGRPG